MWQSFRLKISASVSGTGHQNSRHLTHLTKTSCYRSFWIYWIKTKSLPLLIVIANKFFQTAFCSVNKTSFTNRRTESDACNVPPDYMVTLLESLASICHYCLRDNTTPQSPALSLKPRIARSNSSPAVGVNSDFIQSSSSSVFTNLLHAFSVQSAPISDVPSVEVPKHILDAREGLLSVLPKILSSLFTVWRTWNPQRADSTGQRLPSECPLNLMGSPKVGNGNWSSSLTKPVTTDLKH